MATTPKVLLKRSSVAGRIPDSSDLQYGELAINFADGKLYYKDDANNINAFIDSARVQAIADAVEVVAQAQLDSGEVSTLVDSAYVQARVPLSYLEGLIDSAYIQARQDFAYSSLTGAPNLLDSADVTSIVDSAYIQARQVDIYRDSGFITGIIDSAYVQARQLDSAATATTALNANKLNNQAASYYLNYNNLSNKPTILDTVDVSNIITTDVDKAFVDALNVDADTLDGYQAQYFIDKIDSNTARMLDSAEAIALIDSAYVQARQSTYTNFDTDFAAKTTTDLTEGNNLYYTKGRVDSDIAASLNDSGNTVTITINNVIEDKVDSAYVLARVEDRTDSAWIQPIARKGLNGGANITYNNISGDIALDSDIAVNYVALTPTDYSVPPTRAEGVLWYDDDAHTVAFYGAGDSVIHYVNEVGWIRVRNSSGSDIPRGSPVYVTGVHISGHPIHGHHPTVDLADASDVAKKDVIGITAEIIPNGSHGYVIQRGYVDGINTSNLTEGSRVHLGFASPGTITDIAPDYPNYPMDIGYCLTSDSQVGTLLVNIFDHTVEKFRVTENARVDGNLTIGGNLNVTGTQVITNVNNIQVADNFLYIGAGDTISTTNFTGAGLNDATFNDYYEGDSNVTYYVRIKDDSTGGDLIEWAFDSDFSTILGFESAGGPTQWDLGDDRDLIPLRYNIKITFEAATGHTIGDRWYGDASPVNQQLGLIGNYNPPSEPYAHAGIFRDTADERWKFFQGYRPEIEGSVNTADSTYADANIQFATGYGNIVGNVTGDVTGTVSSISNHTTTNLTEGDNLYYTTARHDSDTLAQVDAAYVQARQTVYTTANFTDSAFVTGLPVSTFTNDANYLDSTTVQGVIDATYIQANQTTYSNVSEFTNDANYLDSTTVQGVIDATYIQANQTTYNTSNFTDSAYVTGLPVSTFTNDANYLDSTTATQLIDSAYIALRTAAGTDSATVVNIINTEVDSAYVQSRQVSVSAAPLTQKTYVFTADSGQATFTGADDRGLTLAYVADRVQVYLNGLLLVDSDDYTATNGTSIVLTTAADSADVLQVEYITGNNIGIDSAQVQTLIDSAYIQLRQADIYRDSGFVTGIVDSAYIQARQADIYRDSAFVTGIVTASYIQTNQTTYNTSDFTDSAFVTGLPVSTFTNDANYLDSTTATQWIGAAQKIIDGDGSTNGVTIKSGGIEVRTDSAVSYIDLYCEVSNAHRARIQSAPHASYSGNVELTLPVTTGTIALTSDIPTFGTDYIDSAEVIKLITANAIDSGIALQLLLDSSEVVNLIDSAYINARVDAVSGTDSAATIALIEATVDSAYVQLRQSASGGGGTVDSADIIAIVDSDYVQARQITDISGSYTQTFFRYTADSGQTVITGTDGFGQTLDYVSGNVDVFLNGILLVDSADYTQTNSSTITIGTALDSGDEISIIYRRGTFVTPNVVVYEYTATAGQATFSGTAANGKTLAYTAGAVQVFVNGILLKASEDYTATDGTSVVLTVSASLNDDVAIAAYAAPHAKATSFTFTADSGQTTFNGLDDRGTTLAYEPNNSIVFLNGIALNDSGDYTASNSTSIVLTSAANLNDELKVVSFGSVTTTQSSNNWTETSTSIKISPNEKKFVDVSSAAVLLEIQDSGNNVSMGDELRIIDGYGNAATNNITLRSTKKIVGSDSDFIIDINRSGTNFVYYNESNGWVLIEN